MKKILLFLLFVSFVINLSAYNKKSLVERYTNASCGPCASANVWYTPTTQGMVNSNSISHIVYNVNWPGPSDPMYLLNAPDNIQRWTYYGVNAVPWIEVNGTSITVSQAALTNAVTSGDTLFSPFKIIITPEIFSNYTVNVHIKILRDPTDVNTYSNTRLKVGLTEKTVSFASAPGSNGEKTFYSITRKMLPDGKGTLLTIPAPGDSIEMDLSYIPTAGIMSSVNPDSVRVVAFIQNDNTKEVYQSEMTDMIKGKHINAAFQVDETMGAIPDTITFHDYSTPADSATITSWKWDFNGDGVYESTSQNPKYIFQNRNTYTVSLTVTDSKQHTYTRKLTNYITTVGANSDILVVNGIDYSNAAYVTEMKNFYDSAAVYGNHNVDIWDLFGGQGFDFATNPKVKQVLLFNRTIPMSVLKLYKRVIWVGNNYSGDLNFFDANQVIQYVQAGGNFLLTTRMASTFLTSPIVSYCGITQISADLTINQLLPLDDNLVTMTSLATGQTLIDLVQIDTTVGGKAIFDDDTTTAWIGGFRIHKANEGVFIFIAGRPYRYNLTASAQNYNYIINKWMTNVPPPLGVNEGRSGGLLAGYVLYQNYPNPFNPVTAIRYNLPVESNVKITIYNTLGKVVKEIKNSVQAAGVHEARFDGAGIASGVYFCQIQATSTNGSQNFRDIKKMVLMK